MKPSRKLLSSVIFITMSSHLVQAASDISISNQAPSDISLSSPFKDASNNGGTSNLQVVTLVGALGSSDVLVTTTSAGVNPLEGKLEVKDSIAWNTNKTLSLAADSNIVIGATITTPGGGGSLNLSAVGTVAFDADVTLIGTPANLTVMSGGISQTLGRKLLIDGQADLSGGSSTVTLLSNNRFGSLKLTGGAVTVNEADSTLLTGVSATSLTLTTAGSITDAANTTLNVTGLANLNAGANAITLGDGVGDVTNFGSLNLTGTVVSITEDSGSELAAVSATSFTLTSNGAITDTGNISVNGLATINSNGNTITLGDIAGETTNFGSLNLSGGAVSISEDSATILTGVNASSLTLNSSGTITDADGSSLEVSGLATFNAGGNVVTLGDNAADNTRFGSLNVTGTTVNVIEDDSTLLAGMSATTLNLTSAGGLTSTAGAAINVTGLATLNGTSIAVGNMAGDSLDFGSLNFNAAGSVVIEENSATLLTGSNTGSGLVLSSAGALTHAIGSSLVVTGNASFAGTTITLGTTVGDTMNFGSLTFNSAGAVVIQEDSATVLTGTNTGSSLVLNSTGGISDTGPSSLTVTGPVAITAGGATSVILDDTAFNVGGDTVITAGSGRDITLSNLSNRFDGTVTFVASSGSLANVNVSDTTAFDLQALTVTNSLTAISGGALTDSGNLSITGLANLVGGAITIGGGTEVTNFGSLRFNSTGAVTIQEDSATLLNGASSGQNLTLNSTAGITNNPTATLAITNNASFTGTSITLGTTVGDTMNFGSLTFNSAGAVAIQENSSSHLTGANAGQSLALTSTDGITNDAFAQLAITNNASFIGTSITLGTTADDMMNFGSLTFNSAGAVAIHENSSTFLTGTNTGLSLELDSAAGITNAATADLAIGGHASFTGTGISLGTVTGDTMNFDSLTFNSAGAVAIQEDSSTLLTGTNTGLSLALGSTGGITNAPTADLAVTNNASFTGTDITLGTTAGDTMNFGSLTFNSAGAVMIEEDSSSALTGNSTAGTLSLKSTGALTDNGDLSVSGLASLSGTSITVGGNGQTTHFGSLNVTSAGQVRVQEDSNTSFVGANTASVLTLTSSGVSTFAAGSTLNAVTLDVITPSVVLTGNNLVDTIGVKISNGGTLSLSGSDTIKTLLSNGGTIAGTAALTATSGATLNGGKITGLLLGDTTTTGSVLVSGSIGGGSLNVKSGTLTLQGKANSNTTVYAGATLKGTGVVNGNLTNNGTLAVGSMGKTLTISGNLVTRGTIALALGSSKKYEQIKAAHVDLGGRLVITNTGSGLAIGKRAFIFDAGSFTNGVKLKNFSTVGFKNGVLFNNHTGTLIGLAGGKSAVTGAYLNLSRNQTNTYLALFDDSVQAGTRNVTRISHSSGTGEAIEFTSGLSDGDSQLVDALNQVTFATPGLISAATMNSLSPEVYRGMADFTEQALRSQVRQAVDAAPVSQKGRTQVYATVHSTSDGVDDSGTNAGYDLEVNGATTGMRYDFNGCFMIGGFLGIDDGSIDGPLTDTDAQGFVLGTFGTYQFKDACKTMITGSAAFGNYTYDATRRSLSGDVEGDDIDSDAVELSLGVSAVVYENHDLRISPNLVFRYMGGTVDSFVEQGAGIPLAVKSQDIDMLLLDVGFDLSYQIMDRLSLAGRVGYVDNLSDSDESVSATFAATGSAAVPFTVGAPGIDNQAVTLGLGLFYDITENVRVGATYRGDFGSDSRSSQTFGIGASYGF